MFHSGAHEIQMLYNDYYFGVNDNDENYIYNLILNILEDIAEDVSEGGSNETYSNWTVNFTNFNIWDVHIPNIDKLVGF